MDLGRSLVRMTQMLDRWGADHRRLIRLLIADAKADAREATEVAVRIQLGQTREEIRHAMGISRERLKELTDRVRRAARRLG